MASAEDWKKIKEDAEAEKTALDAQRALLEARALLAAAQAPADAEAEGRKKQFEATKAAKELAEAQKAAADASKAAADADLAALKAKIGDVPASGYTGSVTNGSSTGTAEAALLAAKASKTAAKTIASALPDLSGHSVLLYAAPDLPTFDSLLTYRAQTGVLASAFDDAEAASSSADATAPAPVDFKPEAAPILAAAGLGLDALNKIFGYFRSDYSTGAIALTVDDSLLVAAVAAELLTKTTVLLPKTYQPDPLTAPAAGVLSDLKALSTRKIAAVAKAQFHTQLAETFTSAAAKEPVPDVKAELVRKSTMHTKAAEALRGVSALHDSFFAKLTTADDRASIPLVRVVRESFMQTALSGGGYLLVVKLQSAAGSFFTVKNFWTFFGGMPLYHMAGVVVSYTLLDGSTGRVLAAGVVPIHGGFVKARKVQATVE